MNTPRIRAIYASLFLSAMFLAGSAERIQTAVSAQGASGCPNPRYQAVKTFSSNVSFPTNLLTGDYNGDDLPDLAVFGSGGGEVLLGDGTGRLDSAGSIPLPLALTQAVSGDFNGDAIPDLAGINSQSNTEQLGLMLGDGTGRFKKSFSLTVAEPTHSVAGDFTGDGKLDLAIIRRAARVLAVYPGDGAGRFGQAVTTDLAQSPDFVVAYDVNGDGRPDLAVSSESGGVISFLAGQGAGRFSPLFLLPVESRPREFVMGDFNRDQLPDLAVTTSNPWQVVIYRGTTGGQFAVVDKLAAERFARVISADFNRDPLPDLAIINEFRVSAFLNGGNGFLPISFPGLPFNTSAGVAEDFNLDGITDLAFCSRDRAGKIMIVSSEGTKQFVGSDRFFVVFPGINSSPSGVLTAGAGIGDFNRDGHLDMAVTNYIAFGQPGNITGNVSILLGNGAGGFQQVTNIAVGRAPHKVVVSDFNGDGKPDLAVTLLGENKVVVLTGDGTGFFGISDSYPAGSVVIDLLAEDFNNDGKTDLAVGSRNNNTVTVMLGDGKGIFTLKSYPAGEAPSSLTAGDFNGDGKLDLAVAGGGLTKVTILPGDGVGAFGAGSSFTAGDRLGLLTAADFNGDNKLDLAVVSQPAGRETGIVTVFVNDGTGRFTPGKSHDLDGLINGIVAPDLNRDGKPDLVLVNQLSIGATVLLNDGTGGFRAKTNYASAANPASLALGDFNKDGTPDLVMTTVTENVLIIYSACSPSPQPASVSAASYRAARLAADSVVAAFGSNLATATATADSLPLPTLLAGTRVSIKDSTGAERPAPLFFVSPNQINYLMPTGTSEGQAVVTVQTNNTVSASAPARIARVAPGLFTANAVGQGLAAALAIRLKADGSLVYEPIVRFNAASNQFVAVPIDLSNPSEQVFLSLFGTGLRARSSLAAVTASVGGIPAQVLYAGAQAGAPQEGFAGLDQVNLSLSPGLSGRGEVDVVLTADGKTANVVKINIK